MLKSTNRTPHQPATWQPANLTLTLGLRVYNVAVDWDARHVAAHADEELLLSVLMLVLIFRWSPYDPRVLHRYRKLNS